MNPEPFGGRFLGSVPEMRTVFQKVATLSDVIREFQNTITLLSSDAAVVIAQFNKNPRNSCWGRIVVKTAFAWLEGQVFLMKHVAVTRHEHFHVEFSPAELALLREDRYILDDNGRASTAHTNYQKFLNNYQFAFASFAKAHGLTFSLSRETVINLRALEKVRNRLTHPKCSADLEVLDMDISLTQNVMQRHLGESAALLRSAISTFPHNFRDVIPEVSTQLHLCLPILLFWKDGNAYEFPNKAAARRFAKEMGGESAKFDFTIVSTKDLLTKR